MLKTAHKLYWKVRDALVAAGVVPPPRFYMRRRRVGEIRERLAHRGSRKRLRRTSLRRLLSS
jgi:hypothetical protein